MSFSAYYCCGRRYLGHECSCAKPTEYWDALRRMRADDVGLPSDAPWEEVTEALEKAHDEKEKPDAP